MKSNQKKPKLNWGKQKCICHEAKIKNLIKLIGFLKKSKIKIQQKTKKKRREIAIENCSVIWLHSSGIKIQQQQQVNIKTK